MGIQMISMPKGKRFSAQDGAGPLPLPDTFDREKFAAKWVKQGQAVEVAKEREWIVGTQLTADGWEVWKDEDDKPCIRQLASGPHILLCRLASVQKDVNAIYGNVGKERLKMNRNRQQETTGGIPVNDPGLLDDNQLSKVDGPSNQDEEGDVKMNPVSSVDRGRVEKPTIRTAPRKARLRVPRIKPQQQSETKTE